ncbi:MAG TPA: hypothetical protein VKS44_16565 [Candidatus Acidoferrales bacterium]|nr:hypothetical protein [Candidatus Acidoferrales bacterium]
MRTNTQEAVPIIGLRNGILTALLILEAAQQARQSRGSHFRVD